MVTSRSCRTQTLTTGVSGSNPAGGHDVGAVRPPSIEHPEKPLKLLPNLLAVATVSAFALPSHATNVTLAADSAWREFTVDNQIAPGFGPGWIDFADGSPLGFDFTIGAGSVGTLTVVDAGFAGDTFVVTDRGTAVGGTSVVSAGTTEVPVVFDFDQALADPSFSRGVFSFGAGSHRISGRLDQSVTDNGVPLIATNGAVRLSVVSAVPEPATFALFFAGLGAVGFMARRRTN